MKCNTDHSSGIDRDCGLFFSSRIGKRLGGWSAGTKIIKIHIPSKVRKIEYFRYKTQIEEITVDENNQTFTSVDGVVYSKDMRCLHIYPCCKQDEEFIVPESVGFFSDSAFSYIMHLKRVVLHKDIIYNYDYDGWEMYRRNFNNVWRFPFDNCYSIEKVEGLPNRYIDSHYFDLPAMYADKIIDKILNRRKDDRTEYIHKTTAISADLIARKAIETIMQSNVSKKTISNLAELFDYHRKSISAKTFSEFYKIIIDKKAENCLGLIPFTTIIALKEKSGDPDTELIKNVMKKAIDSSKGKIPDAKQFCKVESCELVSLAEHSGFTVLKLPSNVKRIREVFSKYGYFNYSTKQHEYPDFSGIKKIIIPKATERIDTLELLVDLEEIEVDPQNELFMSINGLLLKKSYSGVYLKSIPAALKKMCIPKVCTSLSSVDLTNIEDITVEEGNEVFEYNNGYLTEKVEGKTDLKFVRSDIEDIIVPDGVTYFNLSNNGNKDHIKSIIMPDSVIGGLGVYICRGLKHVRISSGIKN